MKQRIPKASEIRLPVGNYLTRQGDQVSIIGKGLVSSNVIRGLFFCGDDRTVCWHLDGRYRWDNQDHQHDLVERVS